MQRTDCLDMGETSMRILHFSVVRNLTSGQLAQLRYERCVAPELEGVEWVTTAFQVTPSDETFVHQLPKICRPLFLRELFAWLWLLRNARAYDYVICRHMAFDPFSCLFARWVRNRVTVHHSKEREELRLVRSGWKGRAAAALEGVAGRVAVRNGVALLAVTKEIRNYELTSHELPAAHPAGLYPNAVCVDALEPVGDLRSGDRIEIVFMCGTFSTWHGLDIILDQFEFCESGEQIKEAVILHLIGRLSEEQKSQLTRIRKKPGKNKIIDHGVLHLRDYRKIFARAHVGLGSLALERKGLSEASTLKVREMLALGIPVYSGHRDTMLPPEFPYYFIGNGGLPEIIRYASANRKISRLTVRDAARPYIDKKGCMERVVSFLGPITLP